MKPVKARGLVDQLQGIYQVSIRRACDVLRFQKSSYFYKARRPSQAALRKRIQEIAATRVTERGETRADDRVSEAAMEDRKREGYF